MKAADLLLIPSRSEAAPLVIGEAACLGTPVLSTETSSALEMIEKTCFGWVCGNSEESITMLLAELLSTPQILRQISASLQDIQFHNRAAVEMFDKLVN